MIVEGLVIPIALYAGKKIIDVIAEGVSKGHAPIVDQAGNVGYITPQNGRMVVDQTFTASPYVESETVFGNLYIPDTVSPLLLGDELALVVVVEEQTEQVWVFPTFVETGYEITLPHGFYSFFVLLLDSDVEDLMDAEILAIGFPSDFDLSDIDELTLEDQDDVWDLLIFEPLPVSYGGPYFLDFLLLDTLENPDFPNFLWELFL